MHKKNSLIRGISIILFRTSLVLWNARSLWSGMNMPRVPFDLITFKTSLPWQYSIGMVTGGLHNIKMLSSLHQLYHMPSKIAEAYYIMKSWPGHFPLSFSCLLIVTYRIIGTLEGFKFNLLPGAGILRAFQTNGCPDFAWKPPEIQPTGQDSRRQAVPLLSSYHSEEIAPCLEFQSLCVKLPPLVLVLLPGITENKSIPISLWQLFKHWKTVTMSLLGLVIFRLNIPSSLTIFHGIYLTSL